MTILSIDFKFKQLEPDELIIKKEQKVFIKKQKVENLSCYLVSDENEQILDCVIISFNSKIDRYNFRYPSADQIKNIEDIVFTNEISNNMPIESYNVFPTTSVTMVLSKRNYFLIQIINYNDVSIEFYIYQKSSNKPNVNSYYKMENALNGKKSYNHFSIETFNKNTYLYLYDFNKKTIIKLDLHEQETVDITCSKTQDLKNSEIIFSNSEYKNGTLKLIDCFIVKKNETKDEEKNDEESSSINSATSYVFYIGGGLVILAIVVIIALWLIRRSRLKKNMQDQIDKDIIYDLNDF